MKASVLKEIEGLRRLTVGGLREKYREVFGEESRSGHKDYLFRRIAWRLQANAEGGLSERARRRAMEIRVLGLDCETHPLEEVAHLVAVRPAHPQDFLLPAQRRAVRREFDELPPLREHLGQRVVCAMKHADRDRVL